MSGEPELPFPTAFRGRLLRDPASRATYSTASGILASLPTAAAIPADRDDVSTLLHWAAATRTPLVPRSAATGMPGGNVGPGIAVDLMSPFGRIGQPDPAQRRIAVEVGATLSEVNARCAPLGLHFPVDPSSGHRCTFGGMLANNSAGPHSVRYGATRAWVHSMDVVLADGTAAHVARGVAPDAPALQEVERRVAGLLQPRRSAIEARWPRVRKNSSGYALHEYLQSGELIDLLIGSEGTLCLILAAVVRLAPVPARRGLAVLEFTDLEQAGEAVGRILQERPATCEMLDRTFLELVRGAGRDQGYPLRPGLEAILLVEMEGDEPDQVDEGLARIGGLATRLGVPHTLASSGEAQEAVWGLRRAASPIIAERAAGRVSMQFIEDSVVPVDRLAEYVRGLRSILDRHDLPAVIFGHAGDGNLHVNPLVDVRTAGWVAILETVLAEVATLVAGLGGTLSGEHGDGRLRAPLLETIWGAEMVALFRQVKAIFDPLCILNPGVILPLPGQKSFDHLRTYA